MSRLWLFLGRHGRSVTIASALLAILLLVAGIATGVRQARSAAPSPVFDAGQTVPIAARVPASRRTVVGVVRTVSPNQFLVRNARGVQFVIRWGPDTRFRTGGHEITATSLRPGDRVVVVGRAAADGALRANAVAILSRGPATAAELDPPAVAAEARAMPLSLRATAGPRTGAGAID